MNSMKPEIYAIIQARMGSSRLPGKVLKPVLGRPLLSHMLRRMRAAQSLTGLVVATTTAPEDDKIVHLCHSESVDCYRGSERDVLDRYYQSAKSVGAKVVVRLTSDCPAMDPAVVDQVVECFLEGDFDYVSNVVPLPSTWPDGQDVEVFPFTILERAWREAVKPSEREHVTFYMWMQPETFRIHRIEHEPDWSKFRLTVDYPEDFQLLKAVFEALHPREEMFTLPDIIAYLESHPKVRRLNSSMVRNAGWQSAFEEDHQAGFVGGGR